MRSTTASTTNPLVGLARGGTFAMVGTAAGSIFGFVLTLVVTHGLTTMSAGEFFTTTAVFTVLQTAFSFGVGAGLVRFIPRLRALDRAHDIPALLLVAVVPVAVLAVCGSIGLWFAAPVVSEHIGHGDGQDSLHSLQVLALLLLPATLEIAAVEGTRGFGGIRSYVLIQQLALPLARPILVGTAIALGLPLWAVVLAWVLPLALALALGTVIIGRSLRELSGGALAWPARDDSLVALAWEYWSFTGARGVASILEILLLWLDVILVAALVSPAQAAIYAAASRFILAGALVLQALRLATAAEISSSLARGDHARVGELYRVASQWVVTTSWPVYLLMAIFAAPVLTIFGPEYAQGHVAMTILSLAMLVHLAAGNVGTVLLMGGRSSWVLANKAASLTLSVVLNLVLIPRLGISGAAIAWAGAIVLDSSLAFAQVRWGMKIAERMGGLLLAATMAVACFGLLPLLLTRWLDDSLMALAVCAVVGCSLYLPLLWNQRERLGLSQLVEGLRRSPQPHDRRI